MLLNSLGNSRGEIFMPNKKAKGKRAKTRDKLKRRGPRLSVNRLLTEFADGDRVQIDISPDFHSGMPFRRYDGISGKISGKQGSCYKVSLREGNAPRTIITHPAHIRLLMHGNSK